MSETIGTSGDAGIEQVRRVEAITDVALSHLSLDRMLPELLDRVRDAVEVDTVAVLLLDEHTQDELVARAAKGIEEEVEAGVRIPLGKGFAGRIAAERRPVVIDDIDHADVLNPILRQKGIRSLLGVPLLLAGEAIGVLHVGSLTPRTFGTEDRQVLELAASRIAPAIDHARLYERERGAREEAERAVAELRTLQTITDAALAHMGLDEMLGALLDRVRAALETDTAAILLLDHESDELVARAARGLEEEVERGVRIPVGQGFAGRIAADARPVTIENLDTANVVNPILREKGIRSLLGAPLLVRGEVLGVMHVGTLTPRAFTSTDSRLLQLAADRVALALEHARLLQEHHLAVTLQQSLLPDRLPEVAGLTFAARYRPGRGSAVGGDWYDVVPLADGGVALVMGDVVSHGIRAASVMVQLRSALRTYALDGGEPARLLERLAAVVRSLERREMVTLAYVVVDPRRRELRYVLAGHPPPIVVDARGARYLSEPRNPPLGAVVHARFEQGTATIEPDSLVVLYTDGLVERRGRPLDQGFDQLCEVLTNGASRDPEAVCDGILDALVPERETPDDVALLVARTVAQRSDLFELSLPAVAGSLAVVRRGLRDWLPANGANEDDVIEILIAVGEAAGNAVEHAYGPGDAEFDVKGSITGRMLEISVRDYGSWRPPRGQNRGRGTELMQQLMDDFEVTTASDGTEVRLSRRLGEDRRS